MKKISIIIPAYNCENLLENCIESIIKQTYKNYEVILVNDGSTDNTEIIYKKYMSDKFKYFKIENSGVSKARNIGLDKASGEYITFLDADDFLKENALEKMIKIIEKYNVDIVQSNLILYYKDKKEKDFYNMKKDILIENINEKNELIETIISYEKSRCEYKDKYGPSRCVGGKLYKRDIIKNKFNENIYLLEDGLFYLYNIKKSNKIYIMKDSIYYYRISETSSSHSFSEKLIEQYKNIFNEMINLNEERKFDEAIANLKFELISAYSSRLVINNKNYEEFKSKIINLIEVLNNEEYSIIDIKYNHIENSKKILLFLLKRKFYYLLFLLYIFREKVKR